MKTKLTTNAFIFKANLIHNNKYNYNKTNYICSKDKIIVTCPEHGDFQLTANNHISGNGCPKCRYINSSKTSSDNIENFIIKANKIHKNRYDYNKSIYKNSKTNLIISCKIHGYFNQKPYIHLQGSGCKLCANKNLSLYKTLSNEEFINRSNIKHNFKYDYSLVKYIALNQKVIIICPIHGEHCQTPHCHLNSEGCKKCGSISSANSNLNNFEYYLKKFKLIHGNVYDYSKSIYKGYLRKIEIICSKHGSFNCTVGNHLKGDCCPNCKTSKGENIIKQLLDTNNIIFESQKRFKDCKNKLPLPFDFYLPEYDLLIEYQGEQHFLNMKHWGSYNLKERQRIDNIKRLYAIKNHNFLEITYKDNIIDKLKELIK